MSESSESKLAESLVWSKQDFSLAEFVESYELPQVILVEVGYCGVDDRTTFSSGQILTLHLLRKNCKIVCDVPHSKPVVIPTACKLKAEVIPMECNDTIVTARQLSTFYKKIKYIRVMEVGMTSNNNMLHSLKPNDILQIKKIENDNDVMRCKNLTTEETIEISIDSTTIFVPLVVPTTCTLAEIKKKFGLPAKVRFLDRRAEMEMRTVPGPGCRPPSLLLSGLGQITAMEEITDSDVIVTTVCSNLDEKVCLNVPTTLDIRVTVAEGFLSGDETYQKVVRTLDKQFKRTDLKNFEDLDVSEHEDAVKRSIKQMSRMLVVEEASPDVVTRAREKCATSKTKPKRIFLLAEKPPPLVPRGENKSKTTSPPPVIPPKPAPKPVGKPEKISKSLPKNFAEKLKGIEWRPSLGRKQSATKSPSSSHENELFVYGEPADKSERLYASVDELYEEPRSSSGDESDGYTELDAAYTPVDSRPYQKLSENLPKIDKAATLPTTRPPTAREPQLYEKPSYEEPFQNLPTKLTPSFSTKRPPASQQKEQSSYKEMAIPPPLPSTGPPKSKEEKQAIYEAIARFPQDLSTLTVADVSRLLRYLSMTSYVETFENELVDGSMLASMDLESLRSLIENEFHVKKLLRFIGGWRPNV